MSSSRRPPTRTLFASTRVKVAAATAAVVLAVTGAAGSAAAFQPASSVLASSSVLAASSVATSASQGTSPLTPLPGGPTRPPTDFTAGRYIVTLTDPAAATYQGGVNGFSATKPAAGSQMNARSLPVQSYSDFLNSTQNDIASSVGASIDYSYTLALNGFAADLTPAQASALTANKSVARVTPDETKHITEAVPSTTYLGLDGSKGVWNTVGGVADAGKGIVIGDIDTGIAPENPSFAGGALGTTPGAEPYTDPNPPAAFADSPITFAKADNSTFHGACVTGDEFTAADCSTKIIGARYYLAGFGAGNIASVADGEYVSPRDGDSHGSHTASTAAGNNAVKATVAGDSFGNISGVAPAAKIAVYKVCWTGDKSKGVADGCNNSDMLAAIDQAVADGVDVLNFSIGGSSAATTVSDTDLAFYGAASAGIFVAASAGNSGPGASTLDNGSPWYTTVAATTIPSYEATATLGDGSTFAGGSITVEAHGTGPLTGGLVRADLVKLADAKAADALICTPGTLDPAKVAGKIVFCQRGVVDRTAKSAEVLRAGGVGMLLVNATPSSIDLDEHAVPTVHLDSTAYAATFAYAATVGATVTFSKGNTAGASPAAPVLAGFSSHGPVLADGSDILKPDVSAPGVAILAAGANAFGKAPTWEFLSGTSMAAPHIAGLAALYLGEHPLATPAEIKSAMMTTATDTVDFGGTPVEDVFGQGAGNVTPTKYLSPGLLYLNGPADWDSYIAGIGYSFHDATPVDPSELNLASIAIGSLNGTQTVTRTVTSTEAGTFTAAASIAGVDTVISPSTLSFGAAGESKSYTVTFTRTTAALNTFATGYLTWTSGATTVRSPLAVQPVPLEAPGAVEGLGTTGSVPVEVTPGSDGSIPLAVQGLAKGSLLTDLVPVDAKNPPRADNVVPGHSGEGVVSDKLYYNTTVAAGTSLARFDLTSVITAAQGADLDLFVDQLGGDGTPIKEWSSATGAANERVDLIAPDAGTYQVRVEVFALPAAAAGSPPTNGAFDVNVFDVSPGAGAGGFTATPSTLVGVQSQPTSYTASWTGLDYSSKYLGLVAYGDTGLSTLVGVTTEAPPVVTPPTTDPPVTGAIPIVSPGDPGATPVPGAGSGPGSGSGSGSSSVGGLAATGLNPMLPVGLAAVLLLVGIGALVVQKRRKLGSNDPSGE
ncbi:S8 family serine peptidase [Subtercola vilae]|uniref:S8 family serine peptidase n=1 Tax=Subtercola vilae TaxID=2056433 RepID=UPI001EEDBADD|nr:S8 family serine peptidase [Subtercola vilae]